MQTFTSVKEAQAAEAARAKPFVEIRVISDKEVRAYETQAEVPPEPQQA